MVIVPYDESWPQAFAAERDRIAAALGPVALRIEPHGSTSVPGLAARPVIDILVSVAALHPLEQYVALLRTRGPRRHCSGGGKIDIPRRRSA